MTINWNGTEAKVTENKCQKRSGIACPSKNHRCASCQLSQNIDKITFLNKEKRKRTIRIKLGKGYNNSKVRI